MAARDRPYIVGIGIVYLYTALTADRIAADRSGISKSRATLS